ncbi:MAG: DinB family protein, partial [Cyanobium sp.]
MGQALSPTLSTTRHLLQQLRLVRQRSETLVAGLEPEDLCLQGMADASPPKWHLGHTTWFFETFLLQPHLAGWQGSDPRWGFLFNSYYDSVGERHPRPARGLLTRPAIGAVLAWRQRVDAGLEALLASLEEGPPERRQRLGALLELGVQHEEQHQELLLMDLLDGFSRNPLEPAYAEAGPEAEWERRVDPNPNPNGAAVWRPFPGGLVEIGAPTDTAGFHFDNEGPRHRVWLEPFAIAERLVRNGEFAAFLDDGGYRRPELWMSEGWAVV